MNDEPPFCFHLPVTFDILTQEPTGKVARGGEICQTHRSLEFPFSEHIIVIGQNYQTMIPMK